MMNLETVPTGVNNIKEITNLRMLLHATVYSKEYLVNNLINHLSSIIEIFNADYDINFRRIELKIKKTNIKKISNYEHTSTFYYQLINKAFIDFLSEQSVRDIIYFTLSEELHNTYNSIINNQSNISLTSLLYNITTLSDNIIVINL